MTEDSLKVIIFPFNVNSQYYVNAIELQEFSLWKDVDRKELDVSVLNLLLSLTDEHSVLRGYTIRPELANIPQKGQVLKSNIGTIVTNRAKWEEATRENSQLRKTLREKDQIMEQKLKGGDGTENAQETTETDSSG